MNLANGSASVVEQGALTGEAAPSTCANYCKKTWSSSQGYWGYCTTQRNCWCAASKGYRYSYGKQCLRKCRAYCSRGNYPYSICAPGGDCLCSYAKFYRTKVRC